jgi:hypothetical protein
MLNKRRASQVAEEPKREQKLEVEIEGRSLNHNVSIDLGGGDLVSINTTLN